MADLVVNKTVEGTGSIGTIGTYSPPDPSGIIVPDGSFLVFENHLILTGSQRITLEGTARLIIRD